MTQNMNQFQQSPELGMLDLRFNTNTIAAQIDVSEVGKLIAGQAIKVIDSAGGVPKVVACDNDADEVFGWINYNIKNKEFVAGMACEISQDSNVIYLLAGENIARGAEVCLNVAVKGSVVGLDSARRRVGYAVDKGAVGQLLRVRISSPSFSIYT